MVFEPARRAGPTHFFEASGKPRPRGVIPAAAMRQLTGLTENGRPNYFCQMRPGKEPPWRGMFSPLQSRARASEWLLPPFPGARPPERAYLVRAPICPHCPDASPC